jgi:hypothetical protein
MTDPVVVIAKAICRCSCSACGGPEHPCWDWEAVVPEARAALAALEAEGMVVAEANLERELHESPRNKWLDAVNQPRQIGRNQD